MKREQKIEAAAAAYIRCGSKAAAARKLGVPRTTLRRRVDRAAEMGLLGTKPVLPGYAIKSVASKSDDGAWVKQVKEHGDVFEIPDGHAAKGYSALVDGDGRVIQQWIKTHHQPNAIDIAETLKAAFADYQPSATPAMPAEHVETKLLNLIVCNDWHVGMFAWHRETGQDWDLRIAERIIGDGVTEAIERSPRAGTAIILGGGDLTHSDNNNNVTSRSNNQLDVDGRHQKVVETAGRLMVLTIDAALRRNERVIVRNLKGNHDEETAPSIAWFLHAWYRNEPRVCVDLDQSLFFYHQHGLVMVASTHGHEVKLSDMPQVMAHRRPDMWGATRYRYCHGFHIHHKTKFVTEGGGVVCESHQTPIPQDAWHFGSGYLSGRSIQTLTYHAQLGEVSRVRVAMRDAANDNQPITEAA